MGFGQTDMGCDGSDGGDTVEFFDCGLVKTCLMGCRCDATTCSGWRRSDDASKLDGALDGDRTELTGTLVLPEARTTIRLQRL
jgi:hypothetical protein